MGRSPCCDKTKVKRGPWSQEEDVILRSFVERFGNAGNWIALPQKAGLRRCGKSCRLRWLNYLRPELRHGGFTDEEDNLILSLYGEMGSKWSVIASRLAGRTDNDVKNYWNTKLKKRYLASTREEKRPPPSSDDDTSADSQSQDDEHPAPATPDLPVLATLEDIDETAGGIAVDYDALLLKSEELYAELVGLIEQQSSSLATTTGQASSMAEEASLSSATTTTTPSSSSGTSPTASSSGSSCTTVWPNSMDVHDTPLLSESASSIGSGLLDAYYGDGDDAFVGGAPLPVYSFQYLLAASYDEFTAVTQGLPY
ncbi:hypothetical protein HU200_046226 [Digitaria exilis]|uniref:Uncharacterized protein n=1 Tax=Digitaria exilis TaxID=1010633 RepID=A0A835AXK5_9POAL|nr:hypothetical protein HU200_046226 [Digitaria exilis]CAB3474107.1 unnamed protein product [Digitaria exilis]